MDRPKSIKLKVTLLLLIKREMKEKMEMVKNLLMKLLFQLLEKTLSSMINVTSALGPSLISLW
jgi:hypothetical protein